MGARARDDRTSSRLPAIAALTIVAVVTAVDIALGHRAVLVSLLAAGPLLSGLTLSRGTTRRISVLVVAVALIAFLWNDNIGSWTYWVPLTVVALSSLFAVRMATDRERLRRDAVQLRALADVGEVAHGDHDVVRTAQRIADVLVPSLADLCVIDVVKGDGRVERVAGALDADPELLEAFLRRPPSAPTARGSAAGTIVPRETRHLPAIDDAVRRTLAHDDEDFRLLQRLATESAVVVPLVARERAVGVLTLATRAPRPRIDEDAVRHAETLAGRVALAIDNALLSTELAATERQLNTILEAVDAAIMVRDIHGRMVYANQAAAELLRLPDVDAVRTATAADLIERFDVYTEAGEPVALGDLPGTRLLRGEPAPPVVVRNIVRATGEERWLLNKATPVTDDHGNVLMAVNLIEDITETKRGELAQRLLAGAAARVAEAGHLAGTLQAIAESAVPELADWAGVDLLDRVGRIHTVAIAHRDPEKVRLGWRLRTTWPVRPDEEAGVAQVVRTGRPELVQEITDELLQAGARDAEHLEALRAVGLNSTMVVPILAGGEVLGALSFVSSTARHFDERDLELARLLGRQAGIAIRNAELHEERAHVAEVLQASLLPSRLPDVPGWSLSGIYRAAGRVNIVGGDFYDVVPFDGGWAVVIGDVVGKGADAAAITALARHTVAAMIESTADAETAMRVLNRRLRERQGDDPTLCTLAVVTITGDVATITSAGHPLPLLRRGGDVRSVGQTSPLLGVHDEMEVVSTPLDILPGDQLLLYTDGVIDALGRHGRFGQDRLVETLRAVGAEGSEDLARRVAAAIDAFMTGEQTDDIAIISLARSAVVSPALS